jgi:gluconolactonase
VSNADPANAVWMVYDIMADGSIANVKVLFNATARTKNKKGAPDGMKVDREGNLFAAGPGGIYVIAPDGAHLGTIETGIPTGNVAWGEDGSSLFVTSSTNVYRLRLTTKGASF